MSSNFEKLVAYVQDLRESPQGCPWTKAQTVASLLPQTMEEMYEFVDAYEQNHETEFVAEWGDLLYHVAFYLVIAMEQSGNTIDEELGSRIEQIIAKHERRLPPAQERHTYSADEINHYWQAKKNLHKGEASVLDGVGATLPALIRANIIQRKVSEVGFEWDNIQQVFAKLEEEKNELQLALAQKSTLGNIQEEIGDVLFTCVNLARHCQVDPEVALHQANEKFIRRFRQVEVLAKQQKIDMQSADIDVLEQLWQQVKVKEATHDAI